MFDIVVKKFTFTISSPDEFLLYMLYLWAWLSSLLTAVQ